MPMARLRLKSRCGDKWMACSLCSEKQQKKKVVMRDALYLMVPVYSAMKACSCFFLSLSSHRNTHTYTARYTWRAHLLKQIDLVCH